MKFLEDLPIYAHFSQICEKLKTEENFVVVAPTGTGKSLGLPLKLLKDNLGRGKILVVQPRRIAAKSLARFGSNIYGCEVGDEIGYIVRFEKKVTDTTQLIYLTDGVLFRLLAQPENLKDVGTIIFDEFHERSLFMDTSLCLIKHLKSSSVISPRIIVTSATIDIQNLNKYLGSEKELKLISKSYDVEIIYKARKTKVYLEDQVCDLLHQVLDEEVGNILIFMDGAASIRRLIRFIENRITNKKIEVLPLFSELSLQEQDRAISRSPKRKIIVSTNIAETSLTIEGIGVVIDTGLAKKFSYDPYRGVNVLLSQNISRSSAKQRAGRAGRTSNGKCIRLWTQSEHHSRIEFEEPEIKRLDITEIYLNLCAMGFLPENLVWLEEPPRNSFIQSRQQLIGMGLINKAGEITEIGEKMSRLPIHPRLGLALFLSLKEGCLSSIALFLSSLDFKNPIEYGKRSEFFSENNSNKSDISVFFNAYQCVLETNFNLSISKRIGVHCGRFKEIEKTAKLLCRLVDQNYDYSDYDEEKFIKVLLNVYSDRLAYLENKGTNTYIDYNGKHLQLSSHSVAKGSQWVLAMKVIEKNHRGRIILEIDEIINLSEEQLRRYLGTKINKQTNVYLDLQTKKVFRSATEKVGHVIIKKKDTEVNEPSLTAQAYAKAIMEGDLKLKNWNISVENFLSRVEFLHFNFPELGIEEFCSLSKAIVLEDICNSFCKWRDIRNSSVLDFIYSFYGSEKITLINRFAPTSVTLGVEKKIFKIRYEDKKAYLKSTLQKFYDVRHHPMIVEGKYNLLIELTAPNGRVVQCTNDLPAFWGGSYKAIKRELAGRYPKHEWK